MRKESQGFSLLEMVVAAAIIATTIGWSIPNYMRTHKQGVVDRYTRTIETGFQNLQEKLRSTRTTCIFQFSTPHAWKRPDQILELNSYIKVNSYGNPVLGLDGKPIIGVEDANRLRCCNSELKQQTGEECPTIETIRLNQNTSSSIKSLRFILKQNTPDSHKVQITVDSSKFTMTPPGSNAETSPLTFMVRSINTDQYPDLKTRCFQVTGSGVLKRGTLQENACDFGNR